MNHRICFSQSTIPSMLRYDLALGIEIVKKIFVTSKILLLSLKQVQKIISWLLRYPRKKMKSSSPPTDHHPAKGLYARYAKWSFALEWASERMKEMVCYKNHEMTICTDKLAKKVVNDALHARSILQPKMTSSGI